MTSRKKAQVADCPPETTSAEFIQHGAAAGEIQGQQSITELSKLLQCLLQQQSERDAKMEKEYQRQEDRWNRLQHQVTQLQVQYGHQEHQQLLEGVAAVPGPAAAPSTVQLSSPTTGVRPDFESSDVSAGGHHSGPMVRFPGWKGPKMQPFIEGEDIEHYLTTFERIAHACQWPPDEWALHLAPLLTGKVRVAYVAMDLEDTMNYFKVKSAVL
ncbi:hypothetical protein LDENG_00292700 [Lucifuga dentata]|nr:hypothetical protein LDENG_00292700 [Lucifuga dentata]